MAAPRHPLLFDADDIVDTVRQPMLVLSADLRVRRVNRSFCQTFQVTPEESLDRLVYDLGNRQWDIEWDREENSVFYDILAFSRPHQFSARLGYPIVRRLQKRFGRVSAAAMFRAVNGDVALPVVRQLTG
jgi:PAS domain-containing protein